VPEQGYGQRDFGFDQIPWDKIKRWAPWVILGVLVLVVIWSSLYQVAPHEQALVLRYGRLHQEVGPGLHLKIPFVDEAIKVGVEERSLEFGRLRQDTGPESEEEGPEDGREEAPILMLTGDLNCVEVAWTLQYQVIFPRKYRFNVQDVEETIRGVAMMEMQTLVGERSLHDVITVGRKELSEAALERIRARVQREINPEAPLDCGVAIRQFEIVHANPPDPVKKAFEKVNAARQEYEQAIAKAELAAKSVRDDAARRHKAKVEAARRDSEKRRLQARAEAEALLELYRASREDPDGTRLRLYIQAMTQIIKNGVRVIIIDERLKGHVLRDLLDRAAPTEKEGTP